MYHRYTWVQNHASVALPESGADIHIFVVKKETFVETTDLAIHACGKEQEHPGGPVHILGGAAFNFEASIAQPHEFEQQAGQRWKVARTVLQTAIGEFNCRGDHAAVVPFCGRDEYRKWILRQPNIRVNYQEKAGFTKPKCLVVIGAKSERVFVSDNVQPRAK